MNQATTTTRPQPYLLVASILQMVLRNGIAAAINRPKPCSVASLNILRTQLLQEEPFFDPNHKLEELTPRTRPSRILFVDIVVLLTRLMRVLMRQGVLSDEQKAERVAVRNAVLDQPFFDRERPASQNPFAEEPFEDEACFA